MWQSNTFALFAMSYNESLWKYGSIWGDLLQPHGGWLEYTVISRMFTFYKSVKLEMKTCHPMSPMCHQEAPAFLQHCLSSLSLCVCMRVCVCGDGGLTVRFSFVRCFWVRDYLCVCVISPPHSHPMPAQTIRCFWAGFTSLPHQCQLPSWCSKKLTIFSQKNTAEGIFRNGKWWRSFSLEQFEWDLVSSWLLLVG